MSLLRMSSHYLEIQAITHPGTWHWHYQRLFSVWVPSALKYRQLLIQVHDVDPATIVHGWFEPHEHGICSDICLFSVWVPIALKHRQLLIQVHDIDTTTNISSPYEFLCLEIQAITHPGTWCWQPCSGSYAFLVCYCCRRGTPTSHTRIDSRWSRWNVARIDRVTNKFVPFAFLR